MDRKRVIFNLDEYIVCLKEIVCRRKLRQGDPLYPLLFTMVVDGLNMIIEKARDAKLIKGLPASKTTLITNLQYANNTIIFKNIIIKEAVIWKWI